MKKQISNFARRVIPLTISTSVLAFSTPDLAFAATIKTSNTLPADVSIAGNWVEGSVVANSDAIIVGAGHNIMFNAANLTISAFDNKLAAPAGTITLNNSNVIFGSISTSISNSGSPISIVLNGTSEIKFVSDNTHAPNIIANLFDKLGKIDFAAAGGKVTFSNTAPITLQTAFLSTGGDSGTINFNTNNSVTLNGSFSTTPDTRLNGIEIENGTNVISNNNISLTNITINGTGELKMAAGKNIDNSSFWGKGILTFDGASNVTGSIYDLSIVNINNGEIKFSASTYSPNITNFNLATSSIKFDNPTEVNFEDISFVNNTGNSGGIMRLDTNAKCLFNTRIGQSNNAFDRVIFESDKRLTLSEGSKIYVNQIAPSNALGTGKGEIIFVDNNPNEINSNLGTNNLKLKRVGIFGRFNEAISNVDFTIVSGKSIYANELSINPEDVDPNVVLGSMKVTLQDNVYIDAPITTNPVEGIIGLDEFSDPILGPVPSGDLIIEGNANLLKSIGAINNKLLSITFKSNNPTKLVDLGGSVFASTIQINQPKINIQNNIEFGGGTTTADSSTFILSNHNITIPEGSSFNFVNEPRVQLIVDDKAHGYFKVNGADSSLSFTGTTKLNLDLTDSTITLPPIGGRSYLVFAQLNNGGTLVDLPDNKNVQFSILNTPNPLGVWSYSNGVLTQARSKNALEILQNIAQNNEGSQVVINNIPIIINSSAGNDLAGFAILNPAGLVPAIERLQNVVAEATEVSSFTVQGFIQTISERMNSTSNVEFELAQNESGGVSAGDQTKQYGSWINTSYGEAKQGARGLRAGYKTKSFGVTIGADSLIKDDITLGAAFSAVNNKVKHKDTNEGDISKTNTYMLSLYGMLELANKWFIQSVASISRTRVDNRELRNSPVKGIEIAKAKFWQSSYGIEFMTGYHHNLTDYILLTPTFGIEYNRLGKTQYQEYGTTNQNLKVTKNADNKLEAIIGGRIAFDSGNNYFNITPEIHGNIRYDILNTSPGIRANLTNSTNSLVSVLASAEQSRLFYNAGCGLTLSKGFIEYGMTYDTYIAQKHFAQQGSLKVRVTF